MRKPSGLEGMREAPARPDCGASRTASQAKKSRPGGRHRVEGCKPSRGGTGARPGSGSALHGKPKGPGAGSGRPKVLVRTDGRRRRSIFQGTAVRRLLTKNAAGGVPCLTPTGRWRDECSPRASRRPTTSGLSGRKQAAITAKGRKCKAKSPMAPRRAAPAGKAEGGGLPPPGRGDGENRQRKSPNPLPGGDTLSRSISCTSCRCRRDRAHCGRFRPCGRTCRGSPASRRDRPTGRRSDGSGSPRVADRCRRPARISP